MTINTIDAPVLRKMFLAGAKSIEAKKEYINELFPLSRKTPSTEIEDIIPNFEKGFKKFESLKNENDLGLIILKLFKYIFIWWIIKFKIINYKKF